MTCNGHVAHCMSPVTCHWTCHQSHCHLSLPPLSRVTGHQSLWSCHLSLSPVTSLSLSCQSLSLSCQSHVTVTLPATSPLSPIYYISPTTCHITCHLSLPCHLSLSPSHVTVTSHFTVMRHLLSRFTVTCHLSHHLLSHHLPCHCHLRSCHITCR